MNLFLELVAIIILAILFQASFDPKGFCIKARDEHGVEKESCFKINAGDNK